MDSSWSSDRRRLEWPALEGWAYLDHALRGPVPRSILERVSETLELTSRGSLSRAEQARQLDRARHALANLVGSWCTPSGVAFCSNTTTALSSVAQAVPWSAGDRVVVHEDEVVSNRAPWEALAERGVQTLVLPSRDGRLGLEDLEATLREGSVRVVSLAAVTLPSGERRSLGAIGRLVRDAGALFVVDGAQAVGALTLDLDFVDVLCGSARKWLLAPPEIGYVAFRPGVAEALQVPAPGGLSFEGAEWKPGGLRFEGGVVGAPAATGLAAGCELQASLGPEWVEGRVLELARYAVEGATARGWKVVSPRDALSGVVILERTGAEASGLFERLLEAQVVARVQGDRVRLSAHFWNTTEDLDRFFDAAGDS